MYTYRTDLANVGSEPVYDPPFIPLDLEEEQPEPRPYLFDEVVNAPEVIEETCTTCNKKIDFKKWGIIIVVAIVIYQMIKKYK